MQLRAIVPGSPVGSPARLADTDALGTAGPTADLDRLLLRHRWPQRPPRAVAPRRWHRAVAAQPAGGYLSDY